MKVSKKLLNLTIILVMTFVFLYGGITKNVMIRFDLNKEENLTKIPQVFNWNDSYIYGEKLLRGDITYGDQTI